MIEDSQQIIDNQTTFSVGVLIILAIITIILICFSAFFQQLKQLLQVWQLWNEKLKVIKLSQKQLLM